MFFSISNQRQDNFSLHWQVDNVYIDTDAGWKTYEYGSRLLIYKGYVDHGHLDQRVKHLTCSGAATGNFCVIDIDRSLRTIRVISDLYRSYPVYFKNRSQISNLCKLSQTAWTDSWIETDFDLEILEHKLDVIGSIDSTELDYDTALSLVDNLLFEKTKQFVANNRLPLKVFLSGGVDTLLVYSYLVRAGAEFELVDYDHVDHDYFWRNNHDVITQHWGYTQIHHWKHPCVLASGAPGDEFMLRSPTTANMYLAAHNTSIPDLLKQYPDCLHHDYFCQPKHQKLFVEQAVTPQLDASQWQLCNIIANDWQHWHLGNTMTWTPLRDLEIFKILLRLPFEHAKNQIMNSEFSRQLIEHNVPGATKALSNQKNTGPTLQNLGRLF